MQIFSGLRVFACMLAAACVLAAPSPDKIPSRSHITRREAFMERQSPAAPKSHANWAGAVHTDPTAKWQSVSGEFVIPSLTAPSGLREAFISVWVAVDGYTCTNVTFKVGVDIEIKNGVASYIAWDEYLPEYYWTENFPELALAAGDVIQLTALAVTGEQPNYPESLVENLTKPGTYTVGHYFAPSPPLCQSDAIWGIEVWEVGDVRVPLTVQMTTAEAQRADGSVYVLSSDATVLNTVENGVALSSCAIVSGSGTITCSF
ncbi:peptidase A4 family-domain-containing protein [Mycena galopus ATCC 62051]|nr:peptidase A4 family-domain-containing protein [Mycena galopus ATCC 62051]